MAVDADDQGETGKGAQRLDKWLFFARVVKSRTLAQKLVLSGGVRLNRDKITNPARQVRPGDTLTISHARSVRVLQVRLPERDGEGDEASRPSPAARAKAPEADAPRPSKKDRRALARLKGGDPRL